MTRFWGKNTRETDRLDVELWSELNVGGEGYSVGWMFGALRLEKQTLVSKQGVRCISVPFPLASLPLLVLFSLFKPVYAY